MSKLITCGFVMCIWVCLCVYGSASKLCIIINCVWKHNQTFLVITNLMQIHTQLTYQHLTPRKNRWLNGEGDENFKLANKLWFYVYIWGDKVIVFVNCIWVKILLSWELMAG